MELQYFRNGHPITFTTAQQRRPPSTVLALPAPPPMRRARREAAPSPPCDIMNRANHSCHPNALDHVDADNSVFASLRQAVLQQQELRHIALAISNGTTAPAWSLDQGLLFFDRRFYISAISPFLPDLLQMLLQGGPAHMALIALGCHSPLMVPQLNAAPMAILLGRPWPQGSTINTARVVFLDNLGR